MTNILTNSQGKAYISSGGKALLSTGGGSATLITKTITQNGTYNASSDNADGYSSVAVNVGGTPTPTGKYQLFDRIKDDTINEIGTVCGFFTDANDVEYAVVVLDACFRTKSMFGRSAEEIQNLPIYNNIYSSNIWGAKETGTENTNIILNNYSSPTLSNIYSRVHYLDREFHEVLPNVQEAVMIAKYYAQIEDKDTSYGGVRFNEAKTLWTSNQLSYTSGSTTIYTMWTITDKGYANGNLRKNQSGGAVFCPVLELPNAL